jgi:hypothetical protein
LFEEPGALEAVARLASLWFVHFLVEQPIQPAGSEANEGTPP